MIKGNGLDTVYSIRFNSDYILYILKVSNENRLKPSIMLRSIIYRHLPEYDRDNRIYY